MVLNNNIYIDIIRFNNNNNNNNNNNDNNNSSNSNNNTITSNNYLSTNYCTDNDYRANRAARLYV